MKKVPTDFNQNPICWMTSTAILLLLCFWQQNAQAQTCSGDIVLETQSDVDNFGPCTSFSGSITIDNTLGTFIGDPITDLSPLSGLTTVSGNLIILLTFAPDLDALTNLNTVGGNLRIVGNPVITSLSALSGLTSVGGDFELSGNGPSSLNGLNNLASVGGSLTISGMDQLTNLNGLDALVSVGGSLTASVNAQLINFNGLGALNSVGGSLTISQNPMLSTMGVFNFSFNGATISDNDSLLNVDALSGLTSLGGSLLLIENNPKLENIDGLINITDTNGGALAIQNNASLTNVDGLTGITSLVGIIAIWGNTSLENVDGLINLTSIESGDLNIRENLSLENVNGLVNLTSIAAPGYLFIYGNPSLPNIDGLIGLDTLAGYCQIQLNTQLTDCCGIYDLVNGLNGKIVTGSIFIYDNATGCDFESGMPTTAVASSNSPICAGESLSLNVEVTGQGPFSYAWSGPAVDVWVNIGTATPLVFGASSGDYSVTVTNACGSVISTTSVVVNTPPVINVPGPLLLYTEADTCVAPLNVLDLYSLVTVSGGPNTQLSFAFENYYPIGNHMITANASNICGADQATVDIVVADTLPPIPKCRNLNIEITGESTTFTAYDVDDGSSDPCGISNLELNGQDTVTLDNDDEGLNVVTMTATDIYGNQSSCEAVITVEKNLCPEGDDGIDSDLGGLPDACDCSPNDPFNDHIILEKAQNIGMDFDGVDDFLSVPNTAEFNPSDTRSITFEAWIKSDLTKQTSTIISKGDGGLLQTAYLFTVWEFDDIAFYFGADDGGIGALVQADSALIPNIWTHVAVSFNHQDSTVTIYYNGALVKQQVVAYTPWSVDTQPLFIGKRGYNCDCDYFDGQMEEVRVWNSSRSQEEIAFYKDKELKGGEQELLANYNFNDGLPGGDNTGLSVVQDHSPFDHDAALSGLTQNGMASNWVNNTVPLVAVNQDTIELCLTCPDSTYIAMDFDGINDEIVINHDPVFDPVVGTPFTFEAWVNPTAGQVSQTILSKGNGNNGQTDYIFSIFQNKIALFMGDGTQSTWIYSDIDITFNTWSHVAIVYDGLANHFTFYLNGAADGQRTIPHGFFVDQTPVYIGRQGEICNCNHFLGQMEEVRIWNEARSQNQIQALMNTELYGGEQGLVAYYSFNNGTPNGDNTNRTRIPDMSLNEHAGTLTGFAKTGNTSNWVSTSLALTGPQNAALDFDGTNDYVRVSNHPSLIPTATNAATYEAWIFPEESTDELGMIFSSGSFPNRNFNVNYYNSTNKIIVDGLIVNAMVSNGNVEHNKWTHIAVTFNLNETNLYINGQLDKTRNQVLEPNNLGFDITVGQQDSGGPDTWNFDGKMDDIRIWDHARTADQIQEYMHQELGGIESGLAAYYNLNNGLPDGDNSGVNDVEDISSNGNTGSLNGFAQMGTSSNWVSSPFNFGDSDKDGIPDYCDACFAMETLLLENIGIPSSAVYRATKEIILGENLSLVPFAFIDLRAPKITVTQNSYLELQGLLTIYPSPCPD